VKVLIKPYFDRKDAEGCFYEIANRYKLEVEGQTAKKGDKWVLWFEEDHYGVLVVQNVDWTWDDFYTEVLVSYDKTNEVELELERDTLRVRVVCKREDETKILEYLRRLSLAFYLMCSFHRWLEEAFDKLKEIDKRVKKRCEYKVKLNDDLERQLKDVERDLNECGKYYFAINGNLDMVVIHHTNLRYALRDLREICVLRVGSIERVAEVIVRECVYRKNLAEIVYSRLKDMKDLILGQTDLDVKKELKDVQKEVLDVQWHSYAMQWAGLMIEFFVVFAYSIKVWESLNKEGFEHSSLAVKVLAPLCVSFGVVAITKFLVFWRVGKKGWKWLVLPIGVFVLVLGIWLMGGGHHA